MKKKRMNRQRILEVPSKALSPLSTYYVYVAFTDLVGVDQRGDIEKGSVEYCCIAACKANAKVTGFGLQML